jgi:uncharacterized protein (DUF4415 family)
MKKLHSILAIHAMTMSLSTMDSPSSGHSERSNPKKMTKQTHGGKREGSGQPSKGGVKKTFRIDDDNLEKLKNSPKRNTDFVNEAIREYKG